MLHLLFAIAWPIAFAITIFRTWAYIQYVNDRRAYVDAFEPIIWFAATIMLALSAIATGGTA